MPAPSKAAAKAPPARACTHRAPADVAALDAVGARLADVCHKAHLYTFALGAFEARVTLDDGGRVTVAGRIAGLPNKVVGLWWPAAAWAQLALLDPPAGGHEAEWFAAKREAIADAVGDIGVDVAERRLAALATQARRVTAQEG